MALTLLLRTEYRSRDTAPIFSMKGCNLRKVKHGSFHCGRFMLCKRTEPPLHARGTIVMMKNHSLELRKNALLSCGSRHPTQSLFLWTTADIE